MNRESKVVTIEIKKYDKEYIDKIKKRTSENNPVILSRIINYFKEKHGRHED